MSIQRIVACACFGLGSIAAAHAGDNNAFTVAQQNGSGKPLVFQSTAALKKGDTIKVYVSNARPILVMQMAMCDSGCQHPRVVESLPLGPYEAGASHNSQRFVVPEDGQVSFWVQRLGDLPSSPVNTASGQWSLQYVDPFLRVATQPPYASVQPVPADAFSLNDATLRARFSHRTFVTVSLADADH